MDVSLYSPHPPMTCDDMHYQNNDEACTLIRPRRMVPQKRKQADDDKEVVCEVPAEQSR